MPRSDNLTAKRKKRLIRGKDGRIKEWTGGLKKSELKKKKNNFHGIQIHIGKEFSAQNSKKAKK